MIGRTIEYSYDSARLVGYYCRPKLGATSQPGVVLVHDAFGVSDHLKNKAGEIAELGYAVLLADIWGDGLQPGADSEIGLLMGRFASDRETWMGRLQAAYKTLCAQEAVDPGKIAMIGYCFGGASVLEYARTVGGAQATVSFHGGLKMLGTDWSAAPDRGTVLVLTGFEDPVADAETLLTLEKGMTTAGIDWEVNVYGQTRHGFTRPDSDRANKPEFAAYSSKSDRRSWAAMKRFLHETLRGGDLHANEDVG